MSKPSDDLEAVRILVQTLEPFDSKDRERIVRWALEKLGAPGGTSGSPLVGTSAASAGKTETAVAFKDIKAFLDQKNPKNDRHLAAAVAYYYRFEAPPNERKDSISKEDLVDACRKAERKRPHVAAQTLVNAFHVGFLDKSGERGKYRLNSVGENLVAMVLPEKKGERRLARRKAGPTAKSRKRKALRRSKRKPKAV